MKIILPFPPSMLSPNKVAHWTKKASAKASYKVECHCHTKMTKQSIPESFTGHIALSVTFYPKDKRHRDLDNCLAAIKNGLDGMALALGVDDKRFKPITVHMGEPDKLNNRVEIEIAIMGENT